MNTNYIEITSEDKILQLSNYAFDGSTFDIYGALLNGAILVMIDKKTMLDPAKLANFIKTQNISIAFVTTALFNTLVDTNLECFANIRKVLFGGERVSVEHVKRALAYLGENKLIHVYGPTETTVFATYYFINSVDEERVPIGIPLSNNKVYILDENNKLLPIGAPGEICITGDGVAKGYLNRTNLTEEKFVENPFESGERLYRSGDLGIFLPDGNIHFMGRIDNQVKIRGYRIELGEVEKNLLTHPAIREAVVIAPQDVHSGRYLCAYLVVNEKLTVTEIREYLSKRMPKYLIPDHLIVLDKMPLTPNGKINRKALPAPNETISGERVVPRNDIEEKLFKIWQEVLGSDDFGVTDDFFEVGGHSLKATRLVNYIIKEMDVEFSLIEVFENPTIAELGAKITHREKSISSSIKPVEKRDYYPLSSAQKRLFVINQLEEESTNYNIPLMFIIEGDLDQERLNNTIKKLIQRHEALRTDIISIDGEPFQRIEDDLDLKVSYIQANEDELEYIVNKFIRPFDLSQAPLFRVEVVTFEDKYLFMMDMHHIISDGTSMNILFDDFLNIYQGKELASLRIQYKDFAVWQNERLQSEKMKIMEEFWLKTFSDQISVLNLPIDYQRPVRQTFDGDYVSFKISKGLTTQLNELAIEKGATLFMVLLAGYNVLLSQYSGQEDIVVGTPNAGRIHADLDKILGIFLNTLALRNRPHGDKIFVHFLEEVKMNALQAYENQEYQFEMLVDKLDLPRSLNRKPLFDVMFVLQNMDQSEIATQNLKFRPYSFKEQTAKMDLNLFASEKNDMIHFNLNYSTSLFKKETVEKMADRFIEILNNIVENSEIQISEIAKPSEQEKKHILNVFNEDLSMDIRAKGTLQEQFYQMVDQYPNKVAIEYGSQTITYAELDQQSNQVANWVITEGFDKGSRLGILIDNRIELITLIFASIKSGCTFIPFDTMYPLERLAMMMKDVDLDLIFTDLNNVQVIEKIFTKEDRQPKTIILKQFRKEVEKSLNIERPTIQNNPDDNAYIYFTSGSTGKPKGILGRYESLVQFICWEIEAVQVNADFRTTQFASPGFDASLKDIFVPLCSGATLCIPETRDILMDVNKLVKWIEQSRINLIHCVPSLFRSFNLYPLSSKNFLELKYIVMAGERINPGDLENWYEIFGERVQLVNFYGPTETTLIKTVYFIQKEDRYKRTIPIGKPMEGARILIADEQLSPCKPGIIGDIYIRTPYMSLGYTDLELTRERFIQNPHSNKQGDLIYRTGDLGRLMSDGNIEFIGRRDNQVKIHGVRIELGDIENQILHYDSVKEVIVIDREDTDGDKYLVTYFVADQDVSISDLRKFLLLRLPEYMLPAYFVKMDKFPLNPNGKIDRKALPEPVEVIDSGVEYVAPRNAIEEKLKEIWSMILGIEKIGIHDNFFEIGGHSLKATSIAAKVGKEFSVELPLREIFTKPTIKEIAEYIERAAITDYASIESVELREYYPVSSAQKRLYDLNQLDENSLSYNMPFIMEIKDGIDQKRLENAFLELVKRHESLRTSFEMIDGEVVQ